MLTIAMLKIPTIESQLPDIVSSLEEQSLFDVAKDNKSP